MGMQSPVFWVALREPRCTAASTWERMSNCEPESRAARSTESNWPTRSSGTHQGCTQCRQYTRSKALRAKGCVLYLTNQYPVFSVHPSRPAEQQPYWRQILPKTRLARLGQAFFKEIGINDDSSQMEL